MGLSPSKPVNEVVPSVSLIDEVQRTTQFSSAQSSKSTKSLGQAFSGRQGDWWNFEVPVDLSKVNERFHSVRAIEQNQDSLIYKHALFLHNAATLSRADNRSRLDELDQSNFKLWICCQDTIKFLATWLMWDVLGLAQSHVSKGMTMEMVWDDNHQGLQWKTTCFETGKSNTDPAYNIFVRNAYEKAFVGIALIYSRLHKKSNILTGFQFAPDGEDNSFTLPFLIQSLTKNMDTVFGSLRFPDGLLVDPAGWSVLADQVQQFILASCNLTSSMTNDSDVLRVVTEWLQQSNQRQQQRIDELAILNDVLRGSNSRLKSEHDNLKLTADMMMNEISSVQLVHESNSELNHRCRGLQKQLQQSRQQNALDHEEVIRLAQEVEELRGNGRVMQQVLPDDNNVAPDVRQAALVTLMGESL